MPDELSAARPEGGQWLIDRSRSTVEFRTRNVIGMKVAGRFAEIDGAVDITDDVTDPSVRVAIPVAGVDSGSRLRDRDLLKKSVFHADQWPDMRFESTGIDPGEHGRFRITGNLRVRDQTRTVELAATETGATSGRHHYIATCMVKPREFGITHPFIRRDVEITIDVWLERAGE